MLAVKVGAVAAPLPSVLAVAMPPAKVPLGPVGGGRGEGDGPTGQGVGLVVRHLRGEVGGEGGADGGLLAAARRGDDRARLGLIGADGADGRRAGEAALIEAARAIRCRGGQGQGADGRVAVGEGRGAGEERDGRGRPAVGAERAEQRRRVDDVVIHPVADAAAAARVADQVVPAADERSADVGADLAVLPATIVFVKVSAPVMKVPAAPASSVWLPVIVVFVAVARRPPSIRMALKTKGPG